MCVDVVQGGINLKAIIIIVVVMIINAVACNLARSLNNTTCSSGPFYM